MFKQGDLLIAHPHWNTLQEVCLITEVNTVSTMALTLNLPHEYTLDQLVVADAQSLMFTDTVYKGGDNNPTALIMLHDGDWYSSNTMPVNTDWSISSDITMLEKMATGNIPTDYRALLGVSAWDTDDLKHLVSSARAQWLVLEDPQPSLVMADCEHHYDLALSVYTRNHSHSLFD